MARSSHAEVLEKTRVRVKARMERRRRSVWGALPVRERREVCEMKEGARSVIGRRIGSWARA